MQRDWRDDRIAELEAELAAKDVVIAAQAARIAEQDRRIGELEKRLAQLAEQLGQNSRNFAPVRQQLEATLEAAVSANVSGLSGSCADILEHRQALWTFVDQAGVEPTNNHAEREIRAFVLWRKRSFGTRSERGNTFAENLMTVAYTARKQQRNVLAFLSACCDAARDDVPPPSLFGTAAV